MAAETPAAFEVRLRNDSEQARTRVIEELRLLLPTTVNTLGPTEAELNAALAALEIDARVMSYYPQYPYYGTVLAVGEVYFQTAVMVEIDVSLETDTPEVRAQVVELLDMVYANLGPYDFGPMQPDVTFMLREAGIEGEAVRVSEYYPPPGQFLVLGPVTFTPPMLGRTDFELADGERQGRMLADGTYVFELGSADRLMATLKRGSISRISQRAALGPGTDIVRTEIRLVEPSFKVSASAGYWTLSVSLGDTVYYRRTLAERGRELVLKDIVLPAQPPIPEEGGTLPELVVELYFGWFSGG